jgi:uncharacterized protein YcbK (DUF882 family)
MRCVATAVFVAVLLAACQPDPTSRYTAWSNTHARDITAYAADLDAHDVGGVVPMSELLRTGRRWRSCHVDEFAVPAPTSWPAMHATLRLVRDLKAAGVVTEPNVASAWRSPEFNRCEGGSTGSKHLANNALDFDLRASPDTLPRLCAWWRRHGRDRRFGLGFYDATRIHVDTSGFRTWGLDYTRRTSLCTETAQRFGR